MSRITRWSRTALLASLLGASLLGASANAYAFDCREHVRRAEIRLHEAVRRHGVNSRQAYERRRELERARAGCRLDHGYWR